MKASAKETDQKYSRYQQTATRILFMFLPLVFLSAALAWLTGDRRATNFAAFLFGVMTAADAIAQIRNGVGVSQGLYANMRLTGRAGRHLALTQLAVSLYIVAASLWKL